MVIRGEHTQRLADLRHAVGKCATEERQKNASAKQNQSSIRTEGARGGGEAAEAPVEVRQPLPGARVRRAAAEERLRTHGQYNTRISADIREIQYPSHVCEANEGERMWREADR